jgi:capsular polysaccharide biosynthesis protein
MERQEKNNREYYTIDVLQILKALWKHVWIVIACSLLVAAIGFSMAAFVIAPTYSSTIKLYVNNNSISLGNASFSISASELSAAQNLVRTYGEILDSRTTLERVIEKSGVDYNWKQLSSMIKFAPANETEIMEVTITCTDPYEASNIANTIAEVLPVRISEIIDGASMEVVDSAIPDTDKVGPSVSTYTLIGFIIGAMIAVLIVTVITLLDDTIHDEEYILQNYDYPILGKVPNLLSSGNKSYGYYSQKHQRDKT